MTNKLDRYINCTVSVEQQAAIKAAALADNRTLSQWIRLTLVKAAQEQSKKK